MEYEMEYGMEYGMKYGMEYGTESRTEYRMESGHCWMGLSQYICSSNPSPGATMPQV